MLISFATENYKSFYNEADFEMLAAPKQHGLDYSLLLENLCRKKIKGLCSSVIYGPNASGKTNIIGAMDVLRAIVLRGNIRNSEDKNSPNKAAYNLELIPNNMSEERKPVSFKIAFAEAGMRYDYLLSIDIGLFLDAEYKRKIVREELLINNSSVFLRKNKVETVEFNKIMEYLAPQAVNYRENLLAIANEGLSDDELFLTNGFKLLFSQRLVKVITDWFRDKFMVIYRADSLQLIRRYSDQQKQTMYLEKTTDEAAKLFGVSANSVAYVIQGEDGEAKLCSIFPGGKAVLAEIFESYGTIRFVNLFPLVIKAMVTGATLIVDEFDASIHPMALMSILNVFHNDDINKKHAQLIFNTHNPIFLNSNILRRDEIKFVEKNDESNISEIYTLADFGTAGEKGVRKGDDYMKNYFVSQYGAIKDIDFSPVFESIMSKGEINGQ